MRIVAAIAVIFLFGTGTVLGFTDNGDNTVTDSRTGLVWQKQDDGMTRIWEDAIAYCEGLTMAGQSDWRLPNVKELRAIVDITKYSPAIDITYFPSTQASYYWSSTTYTPYSEEKWYVGFGDGRVYASLGSSSYYVRCVRGGL